MHIYAVVGGIAAGKSTVARALARGRGARVDADRIGHAVLRLERVRRRLLAQFGPDIFAGGIVDRRRLGARVFGNAARLRQLDAIVHPEIARRLDAKLGALQRRGVAVAILDAALFFELELRRPVDGVLAVTAPRRVRRARLQAQRGLSLAEAEARLRSQPRLASWTRRADVRIDTDCSLPVLRARIERAWRELRRLRRRRKTGRGTP